MRTTTLALIGCVGLATTAVIGFRLNSTASAAAHPESQPIARPFVEQFTLQASGDVPSCRVEKAEDEAPQTPVFVAPECDAVLPGLSQAQYWIEKPDGTVELSADGKTPAVIFAPGDGVAYESIEPRTPLMALIDAN